MVYDFDSPANLLQNIKLPGIGTIVGNTGSHDFKEYMFKFMSFTDPGSLYRVDMDTFEVKQIAKTELGALKVEEFITDQVWYKSKDGTRIPMFVIRKKSVL
jgi:prolyl oligopeptidase